MTGAGRELCRILSSEASMMDAWMHLPKRHEVFGYSAEVCWVCFANLSGSKTCELREVKSSAHWQ